MVCCFFCASRSSVSSTASSSYNRNRSSYPLYCGDPAGIQTQDLQNRNLTLYSAKLQGLRRNALVARTAAMRHWATALPPLTSILTGIEVVMLLRRAYSLATNETMRLSQRLPLGRN